LLDCEYATVTAGCASAITLGTAGVLTRLDESKVEQIPDLTGLKSEVILQKSHEIGYAHAIRNCGVDLVFVESRKDLDKAISNKTAMMWFLNTANTKGQIQHQEWLEVAKENNIPTFNDCAADVPPVENLFKYTRMGYDLVAFSGGKGLRGPQSAGLLLGKKDLVKAARLHAPPRGNTVGRGMKVNKEEILGMLVALELYLNRDHEAEWKLWESQIQMIHDAAASVEGVTAEIHVPEVANHVPSLNITWDQNVVKLTGAEARTQLAQGHPSIQTVGGEDSLGITTWMMQPGQERVVARRVQEVLAEASTS
jgi:L-seryl-tRNA(Ser) seleniumtransferase